MPEDQDYGANGEPFGSDWLLPERPSGFQPSQPSASQPTPSHHAPAPLSRPAPAPGPTPQPTPPPPPANPGAPYVSPALPAPGPYTSPALPGPGPSRPTSRPSAPTSWATLDQGRPDLGGPTTQAASTAPRHAAQPANVWVTGANPVSGSKPRKKGRRGVLLPILVVTTGLIGGLLAWSNADHGPADDEFVATLPGVVGTKRTYDDKLSVELRADLTQEQYADALAKTKARNATKDVAILQIGDVSWGKVQRSADTTKLAALVKAVADSPQYKKSYSSSYDSKEFNVRLKCETDCLAPARKVIDAAIASVGAWTSLSVEGPSESDFSKRCTAAEITRGKEALATIPGKVVDAGLSCYGDYAVPQVWVEGRDAVEPTRQHLMAASSPSAKYGMTVGWTDPAQGGKRRWEIRGPEDATAANALADALVAAGLEPTKIHGDARIVYAMYDPANFAAVRAAAPTLAPITSVSIERPGKYGNDRLFIGSGKELGESLDDLQRLHEAGLAPGLTYASRLSVEIPDSSTDCGDAKLSCADVVAAVKSLAEPSRTKSNKFRLFTLAGSLELRPGTKAVPKKTDGDWIKQFAEEWNKVN